MSRAPQVKPLNAKQKDLVQKAWALGYNDKLISAHPRINAEYLAVHRFRHEMGIDTKTISENRYDTWMRSILSAGNVEAILEKLGESYGVTPYSIRLLLWRHRSISFRAIQEEKLKKLDAERKKQLKKENNPFLV